MKKDYFIKFGFGLVGCESKEEKQARLNLVVKSFSEEIVTGFNRSKLRYVFKPERFLW